MLLRIIRIYQLRVLAVRFKQSNTSRVRTLDVLYNIDYSNSHRVVTVAIVDIDHRYESK